MVKPKDSAALQAFNAKPVPAGYERITIKRMDGPTLRFHGKVLGEVAVGAGPRRLELGLWETPAGSWVAAKRSVSDIEGERELERAIVVKNAKDSVHETGEIRFHIPGDAEAKTMIMDFWEWSNPARSLARKLGWHLEEFVD